MRPQGFEALVAWLAVRLSKSAVQELLRIGWATVGVIIDRVGSGRSGRA